MIAMILVQAANSLLSPERTSELVVMKSTVPQEIIQLCISSVFFALDDQVLVVVTVPCLAFGVKITRQERRAETPLHAEEL